VWVGRIGGSLPELIRRLAINRRVRRGDDHRASLMMAAAFTVDPIPRIDRRETGSAFDNAAHTGERPFGYPAKMPDRTMAIVNPYGTLGEAGDGNMTSTVKEGSHGQIRFLGSPTRQGAASPLYWVAT